MSLWLIGTLIRLVTMVSVLVAVSITYSIGFIFHFSLNETVEIGCRNSRQRGWFFLFFLFFLFFSFGDLNLDNVVRVLERFLFMCCYSVQIFHPLLLWIITNCRSFPCLWNLKTDVIFCVSFPSFVPLFLFSLFSFCLRRCDCVFSLVIAIVVSYLILLV